MTFNKRQTNFVVHTLTRATQFHASIKTFEYKPTCIYSYIMTAMKWSYFSKEKLNIAYRKKLIYWEINPNCTLLLSLACLYYFIILNLLIKERVVLTFSIIKKVIKFMETFPFYLPRSVCVCAVYACWVLSTLPSYILHF